MKILIIPSWYSEIANFFKYQAIATAKEGITVHMLANVIVDSKKFNFTRFSSYKKTRISNENNILEVLKYNWKLPKSPKLNINLWVSNTLKMYKKYERENGKPDLIHAHSTIWGGFAAYKIQKKYGVPYIITEHRSRFVKNAPLKSVMIKNSFKPKIKLALENAQKIMTVSKSLQHDLINIAPSIKSKITCTYNSIDTDYFKPDPSVKKNGIFTFVSIGVLKHTKGHDVLLKAFKMLIAKYNISCNLNIIGRGELYETLQKQCKKLELENNVAIMGKLSKDDLLKELNKSHAFVLATRFEAFGVVFIEAMSMGLPIIGTKSGGPEEIINDDNGKIVNVDNVEELCDAMYNVYSNYSKYNSEDIRNNCISNYGESAIVKQIIREYNKLI